MQTTPHTTSNSSNNFSETLFLCLGKAGFFSCSVGCPTSGSPLDVPLNILQTFEEKNRNIFFGQTKIAIFFFEGSDYLLFLLFLISKKNIKTKKLKKKKIGELPRGYTTLHTPDHSPSPSSSSPSSSSRFSSSPSPSSYRQNGSLGVAVEKVERRTPKKTKRVKKRTAVIDAPEE